MKPTILCLFALIATSSFAATPAENAIKMAAAKIEKQPDHYAHYNSLAMAYARRARETSDVNFYTKAEETLQKSFSLSPDNFEGLKVVSWLQLGRHEFAKALETATKLNKMAPDDLQVYGYMVDANVELGNYKDAVGAAQWMLDLRPGNVAGLVRASYLRELHGNLTGAMELMQSAYDSSPSSESEDQAWLLTQMAHLEIISGDLEKAEQFAKGALGLFPDYHYALSSMAQVRIAQGHFEEAVTLLQKRYAAAPHAENLYALAEAQELAGHKEDAAASFKRFEVLSLAESEIADNSNHELINYYVDHAHSPEEALAVAEREVARRHDILTLDNYAWALAASGDYTGAAAQIQKALATGPKDPRVLYHAGNIAWHLQQKEKAEIYLQDAAARNSREAKELLKSIGSN